MSNSKPLPRDWQATALPEPISRDILSVLRGKRSALAYSFIVPVSVTERCLFCSTPVAPFRLHSGEEYNAEIETDERGEAFAGLTRPHWRCCAEAVRFEQFLRQPDADFEPEQADAE
jgi:hypothetical protein